MDHPERLEFTAEEIARRGEQIYERDIREKVEPGGAREGEFLVVDVTTGDYEVDADDVAASDRALKKNPDALLYFMRVGRRPAYRIGAGLSPPGPGS